MSVGSMAITTGRDEVLDFANPPYYYTPRPSSPPPPLRASPNGAVERPNHLRRRLHHLKPGSTAISKDWAYPKPATTTSRPPTSP
ncbi:MAG: hypothetical protein R2856_16905 [Caldilineaceae bacterium]